MKFTRILIAIMALLMLTLPFSVSGKAENVQKKDPTEIPNHVLNISKENTYPNSNKDQIVLEPSELVKELTEESDIVIQNPELIRILNESSLKPSPLAIGYRGMIFMGHWPLEYTSEETNINWQYQKVNSNQVSNAGGESAKQMNYEQQEERYVKGGLTAEIENPKDIKLMMLQQAQKNTKLPLSFQTVIGKGTNKENEYGVPLNKAGILTAYAPAVNEKGTITFGEVYVELKGSKKQIVIKNITKQGIGAWIPIQDHLSFTFNVQ
ncbi:YfkD famly protein [Terribacillus halophilus]|uniref:YfkD famly protein n=1 Tax=Terribacillus halophilus TaxID=361279 RepID=UPI000987C424|nr:YfkD family protein [Terribacillus halophilus]